MAPNHENMVLHYPSLVVLTPDEMSHGSVSTMSSPSDEGRGCTPSSRFNHPGIMTPAIIQLQQQPLLQSLLMPQPQQEKEEDEDDMSSGGYSFCFNPDNNDNNNKNPPPSSSAVLLYNDVNMLLLRIVQETTRLRQKIQKIQNDRKAAQQEECPPIVFSWNGNQLGWRRQQQPTKSSLWMGTKEANAFPKTWNHHHRSCSFPNPQQLLSTILSQKLSIIPQQPWRHDGQATATITTTITTTITKSTKSTKSEWGEEKENEQSRGQRLRALSLLHYGTLRAEF
jgi:hypothetical protein